MVPCYLVISEPTEPDSSHGLNTGCVNTFRVPLQRNDNDFQDRSNDNPAGRIQRTCKGNTQYNTIQYNDGLKVPESFEALNLNLFEIS